MKKIIISALIIIALAGAIRLFLYLQPSGTLPEPPVPAQNDFESAESTDKNEGKIVLSSTSDFSIQPGDTIAVCVTIKDENISYEDIELVGDDNHSFDVYASQNGNIATYTMTSLSEGDFALYFKTSDGKSKTQNFFVVSGDLEKMYPEPVVVAEPKVEREIKPASDVLIHSFYGAGNDVTRQVTLDDMCVIKYEHSGEHHFSIVGYDENGDYAGLYANDSGKISGKKFIPAGTYYFEIAADGWWKIEICTK